MAKSATIQLKKSTTANAVPTALAVAEPALNTADKKLYSSDGSTVFQVAPSMTEHATKAPLASPTFTGTPTTPTPAADDNSTKVANTSWVRGVIAAISAGVTTFMGRSGNVTLQSSDVTTALGFTPQVALNSVGLLEMTEAFSGNRLSGIDFHSSDGVDYSGRLIREPGANGEMNISQAGSGAFKIYTNVLGVAQAFTFTSDGTFAAPSGIFTGSVRYGTGNAIVYGDGDHVIARSGASGSEKYFRFDTDGNFRSLSGGLVAENGAVQALSGEVRSRNASFPKIVLEAAGNPADAKKWQAFVDTGGALHVNPLNDAENASPPTLTVGRDGSLEVVGSVVGSGGIKWTKALQLPDNTNLDTIRIGGFYDCGAPVNGPPGGNDWIHLEVLAHSWDPTNWLLQRATKFGTDGSARPLTWQRLCRGGTWSGWYPIESYVTPQHYGADGDGIADDTAALSLALNSGFPVCLDGLYRITAPVLVSMSSRNGLIVYGTGSSSKIILDSTTAQFAVTDIDPDNPWGSNQDQVILRDFLVVPNVATTVDLLVISAADGDSGSSSPGMDVSNVHIVPSSTSVGTTGRCFWFHNMRNGRVSGCTASGKYGLYTGTGMEFTAGAGSAPVEIDVTGCNVNHLSVGYSMAASTGATANDDWQGFTFSRCRAVAVNRGWYAATGTEGFSEWLTIEGCHAYFRELGIYAPNIRKPFFHHNYLFAFGSAYSAAYGINTDIGGGLAAYGSIDHNHVSWEAATGIATRVSYRVQATGGSNSKTKVIENMSVLATAATDFGTGVIYRNNDTV